ncbi:MAG: hypothetical protein WC082_00770 [Victivallales bacterium]
MLRKLLIIKCLSLFIVLYLSAGESLAADFTFENAPPENWAVEKKQNCELSLASPESRSGKASLSYSGLTPDAGATVTSKKIGVLKAAEYFFSAWLKSDNIDTYSVWVYCFSELGDALGPAKVICEGDPVFDVIRSGSSGWRLLTHRFACPEQTSYIKIFCSFKGKGKAYVDNISVDRIPPSPKEFWQEACPRQSMASINAAGRGMAEIKTEPARKAVNMLRHNFSPFADWTKCRAMEFPFRGKATGITYFLNIDTKGKEFHDTLEFCWTDDSSELKTLSFPLDKGKAVRGKPDLSQVSALRIGSRQKEKAENFFLGGLKVKGGSESYTIPVFEEKLLSDDTPTGFWKKYPGRQSADISISNDDTVAVKGKNCLKVEIKAARKGYNTLWHKFSPFADFSPMKYLTFYFRGRKTGIIYRLELDTKGKENCDSLSFSWRDDSSAWKRLAFPLREGRKSGKPDLSQVSAMRIYSTQKEKAETWWIDRMVLLYPRIK